MKIGLKIRKIHSIYAYEQKPYLNEYINSNAQKRANATSVIESDIYKLLNNSVFGKLMTSELNYNTRNTIVTSKKSFKKLLNKNTFKSCYILSDNKVMVTSSKQSVKLSSPT